MSEELYQYIVLRSTPILDGLTGKMYFLKLVDIHRVIHNSQLCVLYDPVMWAYNSAGYMPASCSLCKSYGKSNHNWD